MIYIPAILTVGFYFERWRALATGVAMCGSGVGAFIIAPLTTALINSFGWRMTIVIHGGIIVIYNYSIIVCPQYRFNFVSNHFKL